MILSYEDFLECQLFYETLRHRHRAALTNNHTINKIGEIVKYFQQPGIIEMMNHIHIKETNTKRVFTEPLNLNKEFWETGNNYFFNCMLFGFRKNVFCYKDANRYISSFPDAPMIYSRDYYESLEEMDNAEITQFLKENPIGVKNGVIIHGLHRASAMIGRLVRRKSYVSFYIGHGYR